jgi:regulator of replication initiation timing
VLKDGVIASKYSQSLYDNLVVGSEMLYRFCWLSDSYNKVSQSHEDLASRIEKFMEDRVKILQENLELRERLASQEVDLNNMKVQLVLENSLKHRIEVCEAELSKAHDDLHECQDLLAKAEASELGKRVNELEVCFSPLFATSRFWLLPLF